MRTHCNTGTSAEPRRHSTFISDIPSDLGSHLIASDSHAVRTRRDGASSISYSSLSRSGVSMESSAQSFCHFGSYSESNKLSTLESYSRSRSTVRQWHIAHPFRAYLLSSKRTPGHSLDPDLRGNAVLRIRQPAPLPWWSPFELSGAHSSSFLADYSTVHTDVIMLHT